ncbi:phage tail protein [Corallococcus sp. 4LFB]|uniref:phage tail protein n=1 Tax=Corallococcus sp. 4LFB TaxID=3383249 RepID=UPI0039771E8F
MRAPVGSNAAFSGATGALGKRLDPYMAHSFLVELDGLVTGGFTQVEGLESALEVQDYAEGGNNGYVHKLLGPVTSPNLVLVHGLTELDTLWAWYDAVSRGALQRKNGTLMLLDARRTPVMWWEFHGAIPVKWVGPSFDASQDSQVAVERLELAHRGLLKPKLNYGLTAARGLASLTR